MLRASYSNIIISLLILLNLFIQPVVAGSYYRTTLEYHAPSIFYVDRVNGEFVLNGYYGSSTTVRVNISRIEGNYAYVDVYISLSIWYGEHFKGVKFDKLWRITYRGKLVGSEEYHLRFKVDVKTNYAWLNETLFIGFFPLFIFPAIGPGNFTEFERYVYLGERIYAPRTRGAVVRGIYKDPSRNISFWYQTFENKYLSVNYVYHYPIYIRKLVLPVNETTYLYFMGMSLIMDDDLLRYLASISDYPPSEMYVVWENLPIVVGMFAAIFGLPGYLTYRFLKRRARGFRR